MNSLLFFKKRGKYLAIFIFALIISFAVFALSHQTHYAQSNNSGYVTPTLYCLGSCEVVQVSETPIGIVSPGISGSVSPSVPQTSPSAVPSGGLSGTPTVPCEAETVSVQHNKKKKHAKKKRGGIQNGMQQFIRLLIELLNLILRLIGGGQVPLPPTDPCNPEPPVEPSPTPDPGTPSATPSGTLTPTLSGAISGTPAPTTGAGPSGTPAGWQLVASDDFEGTSVDTSKWMVYSGAGNAGVGTRSPSAVTVSNGELKITGKGDVSGGMAHKVSQTYGRWEVRAKIDKGAGYGPAMMLWPSGGGQGGGDIAFSEIPKGDRSQSVFTIHWGGQQKGYNSKGDFSQWHTFTTEWEQGKVTYFIDGQQQLAWTSSDAQIPTNPLALVLQNDIGACGSWIGCRDASTPAEVVLHVDWIRVYKR